MSVKVPTQLVIEGQMSLFQAEAEAFLQARVYADKGWTWIDEDRERFLKLQEIIFEAIEKHHIRRIRRDRIGTYMELAGYKITDTHMFEFNHNLWAVIARYLRAFYPELKDHIEARKSKLPYEEVIFRAVGFNHFLRRAQCQNRPVTYRDWR